MQKVRGHPSRGLPLLVGVRFQVSFTPLIGVLFTFPSRYLFTIGRMGVLRLGGWSPHVQTGFHVPRPTQVRPVACPYGTVTRFGPTFQMVPVQLQAGTGLVPVRSPLLGESLLMSFPPATEMFQFAGFASRPYVFRSGYPKRDGFPHSEIPGSKPAHGSPGLIAACHVLHRLHAPRHPPNALQTLERYPFNSPPMLRERRFRGTTTPQSKGDYGISHFSLHCRTRVHRSHGAMAAIPGLAPKHLSRNAMRVRTLFTMSQNGSAAPLPGAGLPIGGTPRALRWRALTPLGRWEALSPALRTIMVPSAISAPRSGVVVEPTGIEPVTPCLQSRCSPS